MYYRENVGFLLVNRAARKGGIVAPEEEDAVKRQAAAALLAIRDPAGGQAPIAAVLDPQTQEGDPHFGGPSGGELYLSLAPGYYLSASVTGEPVQPTPPAGEHILDPQRPGMQGAFALAGPGVTNVDLGTIRQIDIAPTLAALLGIDPPAQATGTVLTKALARATNLTDTEPQRPQRSPSNKR
jgi:hypothetical protein